jgi:uncharacterized phage-like protein YoqJ
MENKPMEQLEIIVEQKKTPTSCAFTGHRQLDKEFSPQKLWTEIETLIQKGVLSFYNGMAMGFDLLAAECVLLLKKKYPQIRLIACIPCYGQERYFSEEDKARYIHLLKVADEKVVLSENYYKWCMQVRDQYMVDHADILLAYCKKETGGAAYTVRYFKKIHGEHTILFL